LTDQASAAALPDAHVAPQHSKRNVQDLAATFCAGQEIKRRRLFPLPHLFEMILGLDASRDPAVKHIGDRATQ
jgi:hypothetical protein